MTGSDDSALIANGRLRICQGNLAAFDVDAIVNAADISLLRGGGVDGAIHRAAGPGLLEECRRLQGCNAGDAKLTGGHGLPARHVIHTVGPVWRGGRAGEAQVLASCYRRVLQIAAEHGFESLAFPAISCGAYGYPVEQAVRIALNEIWAGMNRFSTLRMIHLVCFSAETFGAYSEALHARRAVAPRMND